MTIKAHLLLCTKHYISEFKMKKNATDQHKRTCFTVGSVAREKL